MRTIKFRAWDKENKRMIDSSSSQSVFFPADGLGLPQYELMQFTGLLDQEGEEVYEGDVVEGNPIGSNGTIIGKVVWLNDGWFVSDETDRDNEKRLHYDFFGRIKKLGNVHENPELLK